MKISRVIFFVGCFSFLGLLFYSSGFMMGRGLLHASLPKPAKPARTPSFDPKTLLSTERRLGTAVAAAQAAKAEALPDLISRQVLRFAHQEKTLHTPTENVELLKQEPILEPPVFPKRRIRPFDEPPQETFYVVR